MAMDWLFLRGRLEKFTLWTIAFVIVYQCFFEPIVGTADNRDYPRVLQPLGLYYAADPEPTMFANLVRKWAFVPVMEPSYLTSQVWVGKLAVALNRWTSKDSFFDIRCMGFVNAALYMGALALFVLAFRRRGRVTRLCIAGSSLVMLTDVRIVAYFNSFLCEPAQVIFLFSTLGLALWTIDRKSSLRTRWFSYFAFILSAVLFCLAKSQNLSFAPFVSFLAYRLLPSEKPLWFARVGGALVFLVLPLWTMGTHAYGHTTTVNAMVVLHDEILAHSKHPDLDRREFDDNVSLADIGRFYVRHPIRWWRMTKRVAKQTHSFLKLGNFEPPLTGVSPAFDNWSEFKRKNYSRKLPVWLVLSSIYGLLLWCKWRYVDQSDEQRDRTLLHGGLAVSCLLQFLIVATFEANGQRKHFFLFNIVADLMSLFLVLDAITVARSVFGRVVSRAPERQRGSTSNAA
jgi:hypothetical protein